jgi:hypothetical protein
MSKIDENKYVQIVFCKLFAKSNKQQQIGRLAHTWSSVKILGNLTITADRAPLPSWVES